jgi:hypothetical protein
MKLEVKQGCPLNKFEPCKQLKCAWFMKLAGQDPNTGEQVDEWGCVVSWLPVLLVENAKQMRHSGAAVESFRNEMVKANAENIKALVESAQGDRDKFLAKID